MLSETQTTSTKIWAQFTKSIANDSNHYSTSATHTHTHTHTYIFIYDYLIWYRLCAMSTNGSVVEFPLCILQSLVWAPGEGDHSINAWWYLTWFKQLSSGCIRCSQFSPDFLVMVIQFTIHTHTHTHTHTHIYIYIYIYNGSLIM